MKKITLELGGQFKHNNISKQTFVQMLNRVFNFPESQMLLVFGAPGIGKTQIVYDFIEQQFGQVIDQGEFKREGGINLVVLRTEDMDRSSFSLPGYDRPDDQDGRRAVQCPFGYIPAYKPVGDMPSPKDPDYEEKCKTSVDWNADKNLGRGLIFLDEINRCNPDAEDVIKNIIERKFCDGWHIGSGWGIVAAGNRMEDDPERVHEIGLAFFNRFGLQFNYVPKYSEWRNWALTRPYMNKVLLDWIKDNPEHFYYNVTCDSEMNPGAEDKKFTTPRTWELACKNLSIAAALKHIGETKKCEFLGDFDVTEFNEYELKQELSPLDPMTVSEFIKFIKMIKVVDLQRIKKDVWEYGIDAPKICNRDGSSTTTAVENAIIKMCIDTKTNGMPNNPDELERNLLKWVPTIDEVKSFFNYLTLYSMSTAQMALQHYFYVFRVFKRVFYDYIRMIEHENIARNGGDVARKSQMMADSLRSRIKELGMYEYCMEFDKCADILQNKWPKLLDNIDWEK